ncbi:ATP-binding cassette domain-containing protein [Pseudomonas sp. ODNR1LW]|nr:ATP-binding cassette domain-containing protein [Pseudomonas sp. ODNR1LW]
MEHIESNRHFCWLGIYLLGLDRRPTAAGEFMNPNLPGLLAISLGVATVLVAAWETYAMWRSKLKQESETGSGEQTKKPILQIIGLSSKNGKRDVQEVHISVGPGEVVAAIGPQTSGASSVIHAVMEQSLPVGGDVIFNGHSVLGMSKKEYNRLGIVYVHHDYENTKLSVEAIISKTLQSWAKRERMSDADIKRTLNELIETFDLEGDRGSPEADLLPWKKQKVWFAKILARNPKLILLDQLFSMHTDPEAHSVTTFINYAKARGIGTLIATFGKHAELALKLSDRGYVFADGRIVAEGPREMLTATPEAKVAVKL